MINMDFHNIKTFIEVSLNRYPNKADKISLIGKLIIWLSNLKHDIKRGKKK